MLHYVAQILPLPVGRQAHARNTTVYDVYWGNIATLVKILTAFVYLPADRYHWTMNTSILQLFLLTGTAFVTWWFLLGLLNPFIDSASSIIKCAVSTVFFFFFGPIIKLINKLYNTIIKPVRRTLQKVHLPYVIKAIFYLFLGVGIVILDQLYATKIFAEDQTTFYNIVFQGKKYWITQIATIAGGFFIGLGTLYTLDLILNGINKLLDRMIRISIVIRNSGTVL